MSCTKYSSLSVLVTRNPHTENRKGTEYTGTGIYHRQKVPAPKYDAPGGAVPEAGRILVSLSLAVCLSLEEVLSSTNLSLLAWQCR